MPKSKMIKVGGFRNDIQFKETSFCSLIKSRTSFNLISKLN